METIKLILFVYLLFEATPCANCQTPELAGYYVGCESYETKHDLRLHKDGSFQYILKEGLACDTIVGEWNIFEKKQIILTPIKTFSYHIESNCDTCSENYNIKTYALPDNYELTKPDLKVYVIGEIIEVGITNSVKYSIIQKADSIQINYFGFKSYVFVPQERKNVIVKVFLVEERQEVLQRNVTLKIKKNKLVPVKGCVLKKVVKRRNL